MYNPGDIVFLMYDDRPDVPYGTIGTVLSRDDDRAIYQIEWENGQVTAAHHYTLHKFVMTFSHLTPSAVKVALARANHQDVRVRLWYGDTDTGRSWMDEFDVIGQVGRSMGPTKIPLLIRTRRSDGGSAILDHCIIRLDVNWGDHKETLYRHPNFHLPELTITPSDMQPEYVENVLEDGQIVARFRKPGQAARWIAFMRGERWNR